MKTELNDNKNENNKINVNNINNKIINEYDKKNIECSIYSNNKKIKSHIQDDLINKNDINYVIAIPKYWEKINIEHDIILLKTMKHFYGFDKYRFNQKAIIKAVKNNKDVFACLPTGAGKSLTFQLSAITSNGVTIVIMPLISLIEDQYTKLKNLGINCIYIKSKRQDINCDFEIIENFQKILNQIEDYPRLLFMTPEKLYRSIIVKDYLIKLYNKNLLNRIVVDEAHCVSQWGHDFRKDYLNIKNIKNECPKVPILALTATATDNVRIDIINQLNMNSETLYFKSTFNRPNIHYEIIKKSKKCKDDIVKLILNKFKNDCGIIYCTTIKETENMIIFLNKKNINATCYNSNMNEILKNISQNSWMNNKCKIMIATIAFGMGIDKPNVRFVIHYNLSKCIENYYQESGRVGRDNNKSYCYLFYKKFDSTIYDYFISKSDNINNKIFNRGEIYKLNNMKNYCEDNITCRRKILLDFFGEKFNNKNCNKSCDNCINKIKYNKIDVKELILDIIKSINFEESNNTINKIKWNLLNKNNIIKSNFKYKNYLDILFNKLLKKEIIYELLEKKKSNEYIRKLYLDNLKFKNFKNCNKKCFIKVINIEKKSIYINDEIIESLLTKSEYDELYNLLQDKRYELAILEKNKININLISDIFPKIGLKNIAFYLLTEYEEMIKLSNVNKNFIDNFWSEFSIIVKKFILNNNIIK